jgi:C4-dicarboxylate transporter DctM subunit
MTKIALPEVLDRKYSPALAAGSIASGGTLGMLIPPSVIMVLYGVLTEQFVIALFVAAVVPGIMAVIFYFVAIAIQVRINPDSDPAGPKFSQEERRRIFAQSWSVISLTIVVSGGIYAGIFTVAEAAAIGATLSFLYAWGRGKLTREVMWDLLTETAGSTGIIYLIIIGASIFSYFVTLSGLLERFVESVSGWGGNRFVILLMLYVMYLILGSIFDTVAAMVLTLPFVFPLTLNLGFDPIWFGVINVMVMVIETGMITPPIGINVFVLHGMARNIPMPTIFKGIIPFLIAGVAKLAMLTVFPAIALWLPRVLGTQMLAGAGSADVDGDVARISAAAETLDMKNAIIREDNAGFRHLRPVTRILIGRLRHDHHRLFHAANPKTIKQAGRIPV